MVSSCSFGRSDAALHVFSFERLVDRGSLDFCHIRKTHLPRQILYDIWVHEVALSQVLEFRDPVGILFWCRVDLVKDWRRREVPGYYSLVEALSALRETGGKF